MQTHTALVLGATGGVGREVACQLRDAGWNVRALHRKGAASSQGLTGVEWMRGDAMQRDDVMAAAQGCTVIVHAVNPPGYRRWADLVLPMVDNTVAAACAQNATVVLPGTVYNYGPDAFPVLTESSPQHPATRKGAIRVELEQRLRRASQGPEGRRCQTIVVRAGDFFGPAVGNSWFSQGLIQPGKPVTTIKLPGQPGTGHQWSYVPDVARTMVALIERRHDLERFASFHMQGHWDCDGKQMAASIARAVTGNGGLPPAVRKFPWWATAVAAPFSETLRELREMRYLWEQPVRMDNSRLLHVLGAEPHTPWDQAVQATLRGQGCLPADAVAVARPRPSHP